MPTGVTPYAQHKNDFRYFCPETGRNMPTRVTPYAQHKDDNRFGRGTDLLILSIFPLSLGGGQGCVYRGSLMC
ncbi:hypothetical protein Y032_0232g3064 [Ancylostoma ceylanicum]|uniref:Uncharacterized protein n=1 Tax=Ancylostoma ceylanicum TaxID=53326 RepID=A0A016SGH7_9BILA|nr:hypothetical protein Y032_0232g3064 [Ancylostoma ceylanicum]